jgi:hypothetical protein
MPFKPAFPLTPVLLCLVAGSARADLAPYSFGASETLSHQSNINHSLDSDRVADWLSTTELRAAVDQPLGRDELKANAAVDFNHYRRLHGRNDTGYQLGTEFDWSLPGDLSGSLGAETRRRQYLYGLNGEGPAGTSANQRNMETDNHFYAHGQIGGESRWTLYGGVDATQRRYSQDIFRGNNERQWAANAGTRYATSPDLSFGLQGSYVHGDYPNLNETLPTAVGQSFSMRSVDFVTNYTATGNSKFDGRVGYTTQTTDLQDDRHFVNGALNWTWAPPSHFTVRLGLSRDSDADTGGGLAATFNPNGINGRSINDSLNADVTYALTAKVSLDLSGQYVQRKYSHALLPVVKGQSTVHADGTNRTSHVYLSAHYQPTRNSDVSCGAGREVRHAGASIAALTPGYTDNTVQCVAAIDFK